AGMGAPGVGGVLFVSGQAPWGDGEGMRVHSTLPHPTACVDSFGRVMTLCGPNSMHALARGRPYQVATEQTPADSLKRNSVACGMGAGFSGESPGRRDQLLNRQPNARIEIRRTAMIPRYLFSLALAAGVGALVARPGGAQDKASTAPAPDAVRTEVLRRQETLAQKFRDLQAGLLHRAQRLERRPGPEDRALADSLRRALNWSLDEALAARFEKSITVLKTPKDVGIADILEARKQAHALQEKLRAMLTALAAAPRDLPAFLQV